jgi:hypothetical protein
MESLHAVPPASDALTDGGERKEQRKPPRRLTVQDAGLEPATFGLQNRCSTS